MKTLISASKEKVGNNAKDSIQRVTTVQLFKNSFDEKGKIMKELFSGHGKAEYNMGLAPIPTAWRPGPPKWR